MAKDITFSAAGQFHRAAPGERKASLIERGAKWLASFSRARNDEAIERYINEHGGALTDSIEREIAQRFINGQPGRF